MKILFRSFGFILAVVGILAILVLLWTLRISSVEESGVRTPAENPYDETIAASGIIESVDRNIAIGAPASGIITEIFVQVSDRVDKSAPLFQVDPRELEADLRLQRANVEVAKATVQRLRDQLKRLKEISDPRAVSQDLIETRENDVKVAEAELTAAKARLEQTRLLIGRLTVRAPREGTILQNNIRVGEYYPANSQEPAMLLGNIDQLQVRVDIDEQNASRFRPSFEATAYPKNNPTIKIPLEFDRVEPYVIPKKSLTGASNERVDTRVLQVIYRFKHPDQFQVFVGQQVDVFIHETI
jgi:RND family efflux transporter MFP subunit